MNYEQFISTIIEKLSKNMHNISIDVKTFQKNNGVVLHGLIFEDSCNASLAIYLERFYEYYRQGKALADIVQEIEKIYEDNKVVENVDMSFFSDFEKIKSNIICNVINYEKNRELLKNVPFVRIFDLAVVFKVVVNTSKYGIATILVGNQQLKNWKQSVEVLYHVALGNTAETMEFTIKRIDEVIGDILENEIMPIMQMYVITNKWRLLGASAILYEKNFAMLADEIKSDLYILPSSIHELIVVPAKDLSQKNELVNIVCEINNLSVTEEEFLSNNVYYYVREKGQIIM